MTKKKNNQRNIQYKTLFVSIVWSLVHVIQRRSERERESEEEKKRNFISQIEHRGGIGNSNIFFFVFFI